MAISKKRYVGAGEVFIEQGPIHLWTVLGSCVTVLFHNKRLGISAICHAKYPSEAFHGNICSANCTNPCHLNTDGQDFSALTCAVKHMVNSFRKLGIKPGETEVCLAGGSSQYGIQSKMGKTVGEQNVEMAHALLKKHRLNILQEETLGKVGRRLDHNVQDGTTQIKLLIATPNTTGKSQYPDSTSPDK